MPCSTGIVPKVGYGIDEFFKSYTLIYIQEALPLPLSMGEVVRGRRSKLQFSHCRQRCPLWPFGVESEERTASPVIPCHEVGVFATARRDAYISRGERQRSRRRHATFLRCQTL